jgi:hypothetical protein
MKQPENGKETHSVFSSKVDCNVRAVSGALIIIKGNGVSTVKGAMLLVASRDEMGEKRSATYLDMLEQWLWPQLKKNFPWKLHFQQDIDPPLYHKTVRDLLDRTSRTHSLALCISGPYSTRLLIGIYERTVISTFDATVPSRDSTANFTGHSKRR